MAYDNMLEIIVTLFVLLFGSIIGVYVFTIKVYKDVTAELGKIYELINKHTSQQSIHRDEVFFVPSVVCAKEQEISRTTLNAVKESLNKVDVQVNKIDSKLDRVLDKMLDNQ